MALKPIPPRLVADKLSRTEKLDLLAYAAGGGLIAFLPQLLKAMGAL